MWDVLVSLWVQKEARAGPWDHGRADPEDTWGGGGAAALRSCWPLCSKIASMYFFLLQCIHFILLQPETLSIRNSPELTNIHF